MTTAEKTIKEIESKPGYSYNRQIVEQVCDAGYSAIEDGTVIMTNGDQQLIKQGNDLVCIKDGTETKRSALDDAAKERTLMLYAMHKSAVGTHMGTIH